MNKLLKLQLRNVFHNKLFYVCLALTALTPIITFIGEITVTKTKTMVFPEIISFISGELSLISEIFIALFACFDFNEGTTKNIIARGYTRLQLLVSKYIAIFVSLFTMYIITSLLIFILFIRNGMGFDPNMLSVLLISIIGICATAIFYSTIAFLLEKNSSAIIATLCIPMFIPLITLLLDSNLKLDIGKFWIENVSNIFIKNQTLANFGLSTLIYGVYIFVVLFIGTKLLNKKEIK